MNQAQRASSPRRKGLRCPTAPISCRASRGQDPSQPESSSAACRRRSRPRRPPRGRCRRRPRRRPRPQGTSRADEAQGRPCRPLEPHGRVEAGRRQRACRRLPRLRGFETRWAHVEDELRGRDACLPQNPGLGAGLRPGGQPLARGHDEKPGPETPEMSTAACSSSARAASAPAPAASAVLTAAVDMGSASLR